MEEKIYSILNELGVPFNLLGRRYIAKAVELIAQKGRLKMVNEVYPQIAEGFDTLPTRVERAIRHAVEKAFSNGNTNALTKYFGVNISYEKGKLTNTEFIYGLVEYLRIYR